MSDRAGVVGGDDEYGAVEAEPDCAATVFGSRIELARRYTQFLATAGIERGLIGPRESGRLWSRHVLNCAVLGEAIPEGVRVVDIGSGAGLPGIPLALVRPDVRIDLVEPLLRRSTFLEEIVADLGLTQCRVIRGRAEETVAEVGGADVVTARAVAPLAKLGRWAAPLLRVGGTLMAMKGASAADEIERDREAVARSGIEELRVVLVGGDVLADSTTIVVGTRVADRRRGPTGGRVAGARGKGPHRRRKGGGRRDA